MDEQIKFMQVVKQHRIRAAILFALGTGLRIGEMMALKWSDIDLCQAPRELSSKLCGSQILEELPYEMENAV